MSWKDLEEMARLTDKRHTALYCLENENAKTSSYTLALPV